MHWFSLQSSCHDLLDPTKVVLKPINKPLAIYFLQMLACTYSVHDSTCFQSWYMHGTRCLDLFCVVLCCQLLALVLYEWKGGTPIGCQQTHTECSRHSVGVHNSLVFDRVVNCTALQLGIEDYIMCMKHLSPLCLTSMSLKQWTIEFEYMGCLLWNQIYFLTN